MLFYKSFKTHLSPSILLLSKNAIQPFSYYTSLSEIFFFSFFFCIFSAAAMACGSSQVRGQIAAAAAGLCHSHSNARSQLPLQPMLQLAATPDA